MSTYYQDHLLKFLPAELIDQDVDGDLSAYLEVVALSMDEIEEAVSSFETIFDVDACDEKYLPYIAKILHFPLSERDTVAQQRIQLKQAVSWYKRKGLHEGFRIMFYSLGYMVNLVELWTKDYESFYRYPGTWKPPLSKAVATSVRPLIKVSITSANNMLLVAIDGSDSMSISLPIGEDILIEDIAAYIDSKIDVIGGDCFVEGGARGGFVEPGFVSDTFVSGGLLKIQSRLSGESSLVLLTEVDNQAYGSLGLTAKLYTGINYRVPDDWPELQENNGDWYKSSHFGLEVYSIRDYVIDEDEFFYIRDRLELIRPVHTVLDFITYIKALSDAVEISEENAIGSIAPNLVEVWPFTVCMDRGKYVEFEYIRDGLVPNRSGELNIGYKHIRDANNLVHYRDEFEYTYTNLSRALVDGPEQMPDRRTARYYRNGWPQGEPTRDSCAHDTEEVRMEIGATLIEDFCGPVLRDGGAYFRDVPDTYYRDGSFSLLTSRDPCLFRRDGINDFDRSGCFPPFEEDRTMLFTRADLPGVYFETLAAMTDPDNLGLDPLPNPSEGPSLG